MLAKHALYQLSYGPSDPIGRAVAGPPSRYGVTAFAMEACVAVACFAREGW